MDMESIAKNKGSLGGYHPIQRKVNEASVFTFSLVEGVVCVRARGIMRYKFFTLTTADLC